MKTLNKQITAGFFREPDGYQRLVRRWSTLMQDPEARKQVSRWDHVLYLILRGRNWQTALTPPTNSRKVENGARVGWEYGYHQFIQRLHDGRGDVFGRFGDLLAEDICDRMREVIPARKWSESVLEGDPYAGD